MVGIAAPVITGLAAGIAFIILMSLADFQPMIRNYTGGMIDDINPRFDIDDIDRKKAVDIILQNSTVVGLLECREVYISAISGVMDCSYGDCARIYLWQRDDSGAFAPQQALIMVDYTNARVASIQHTDGW